MATATRSRKRPSKPAKKAAPAPSPGQISHTGDDTRAKIKTFVQEYWVEQGCAPTLTEIAAGTGLSSHAGVRLHLLVMRNRGEVTWQEGKFRTLRVVDPAA